MTREEVAKLLAVMTAYWPNFPHQGDITVKAWHRLLEHVPAEPVYEAIVALAATSRFPPTVAEVLEEMAKAMLPPEARMLPEEAWLRVVHAIRSTPPTQAPQLPGIIGKAAEIVGWWTIRMSDDPLEVQRHYMRVFAQLQKRLLHHLQLPPSLRKSNELNALLNEFLSTHALSAPEAEPQGATDGQGAAVVPIVLRKQRADS